METFMELKGKTALITGGTTGIGYETARLFMEHGARVAITGLDQSRLDGAKMTLGPSILAIQSDARRTSDLRELASTVGAHFPQLDVLFANAGVAFATPLDGTSEDLYDAIMEVNVKGVFMTIQACLPLMKRGGTIILNTSWLADVGTAGLSILSASKAAVRSFARTLSAELLEKGIRVNAVSPGATQTPIHGKTGMSQEQLQAFAERLQGAIPLRRFGQPEEVAQAALFLASDRSSYMLGAEIAVDGGFAQL
jgi:NAD(P)-dependent dehydrogenase (short-subunit alcohol dehydrogenase family)